METEKLRQKKIKCKKEAKERKRKNSGKTAHLSQPPSFAPSATLRMPQLRQSTDKSPSLKWFNGIPGSKFHGFQTSRSVPLDCKADEELKRAALPKPSSSANVATSTTTELIFASHSSHTFRVYGTPHTYKMPALELRYV